MPGDESEGKLVSALEYVEPRRDSWARAELGFALMYWARSEACSPSTLISNV